MTGRSPIVIASKNRQQFAEHCDVARAIEEAERLAGKHDDEFIVYVPVAISRQPPRVVTETISDLRFWPERGIL